MQMNSNGSNVYIVYINLAEPKSPLCRNRIITTQHRNDFKLISSFLKLTYPFEIAEMQE